MQRHVLFFPCCVTLLLLITFTLALPAQAQVVSTGRFSCAVLTDGSLKCWGYNTHGQLGQGDTNVRGDGANEMGANLPAISLGAGRTAVAVSVGYTYVCALLDDETVKCWGLNNLGQLGQGDTNNRGDAAGEMGDNLPAIDLGTNRTATALATGQSHTCAILDSGAVKCWGYNAYGQLGYGDTSDRGDGASEMGSNLPTVDLGNGRTATAIAAGYHHTCAVLDDGTVKCWGRNNFGQLGYGDTQDRGDGASEMGNNLPTVALGAGRTAKRITAGFYHTCAILDDGSAKCWGQNNYGQLGQGDTNNRGDAAGEMGDNLPAIALGTGRSVTVTAPGNTHSCAVLDDDTVKCWGRNNFGQLGYGDTQDRGDGASEMGDNLPTVALGAGRTARSIATGLFHSTCALLDDDTVKCWGQNNYGQLGQGDTNVRGDGAGEMGANLLAIDLNSGVLPVELVAFTATLDGSTALLRWTTASETNNSGFDVEHRTGASSFQTVGFQAGHGTTLEASSYAQTVTGLAPGTHLFRLRQVDFDGAFEYSPEVELTLEADGLALALVGLPASEALRGTLIVPNAGAARVTLYDVLGRKQAEQDVPAGAFTFDVSTFAAGSYVLRVESGSQAITRSVSVLR